MTDGELNIQNVTEFERYWWNLGRASADEGVYFEPYTSDENGETGDPENDDANSDYRQGFNERRAELGSRFRWK